MMVTHMGRDYEHRKAQRDAKKEEQEICNICGSTENLESHHLVEVCEGGAADTFNIVILCRSCHSEWHNEGLEGVTIERF